MFELLKFFPIPRDIIECAWNFCTTVYCCLPFYEMCSLLFFTLYSILVSVFHIGLSHFRSHSSLILLITAGMVMCRNFFLFWNWLPTVGHTDVTVAGIEWPLVSLISVFSAYIHTVVQYRLLVCLPHFLENNEVCVYTICLQCRGVISNDYYNVEGKQLRRCWKRCIIFTKFKVQAFIL